METIEMIDVKEIIPGNNDRTTFDKSALKDLADNIRQNGLIQPITVRYFDETKCFQIVAGERRFRACKDILGWAEIPAIVKDLTDIEASSIMLSENIARENLDPIDEALAYASRIEMFNLSISEIATLAGVSSIRVKFRIKLLNLRPDIQNLIRTGNLSIGYAQILSDATLDNNRQMLAIQSLRDYKHPTPSWFRRIVNELLEQQAQGLMFEMPLLGGPQFSEITDNAILPPTPSDTKPPRSGKSIHEIITNQSSFWSSAADAWDALGKPFKRQECEAASKALQLALSSL